LQYLYSDLFHGMLSILYIGDGFLTLILTLCMTLVALAMVIVAVIIVTAIVLYCCFRNKMQRWTVEQRKSRARSREVIDRNTMFRESPQMMPKNKHDYDGEELIESSRNGVYTSI